MKSVLIILLVGILSSCSPRHATRERGGYSPQVGDRAEVVLYHLGPSYFQSSGPHGGLIDGYLWDPHADVYSGFGPSMIDEAMPGVQVVLLYYYRGYVRDMISVEGGVTDDMLSGDAQRLFLQKWSEEEDEGRRRTNRD